MFFKSIFLQLLSGTHSLARGSGTQQISPTGFIVQPGQSTSISVPTSWSGPLWGRTLCTDDSPGKFSCLTGDCGSSTIECSGGGAIPPATLVEFTLNGVGGSDFYDVSLVHGYTYNLPMLVSPHGQNGMKFNIHDSVMRTKTRAFFSPWEKAIQSVTLRNTYLFVVFVDLKVYIAIFSKILLI